MDSPFAEIAGATELTVLLSRSPGNSHIASANRHLHGVCVCVCDLKVFQCTEACRLARPMIVNISVSQHIPQAAFSIRASATVHVNDFYCESVTWTLKTIAKHQNLHGMR
eukprot:1900719-Amphidinium_carterae.1